MSTRDTNPIQLSRMELQVGKRNRMIAPLERRFDNGTFVGTPREQSVISRERATGNTSGSRGANSRLENSGKESKLVDISEREFAVRKRRTPIMNFMRTPRLQKFGEGERPVYE